MITFICLWRWTARFQLNSPIKKIYVVEMCLSGRLCWMINLKWYFGRQEYVRKNNIYIYIYILNNCVCSFLLWIFYCKISCGQIFHGENLDYSRWACRESNCDCLANKITYYVTNNALPMRKKELGNQTFSTQSSNVMPHIHIFRHASYVTSNFFCCLTSTFLPFLGQNIQLQNVKFTVVKFNFLTHGCIIHISQKSSSLWSNRVRFVDFEYDWYSLLS